MKHCADSQICKAFVLAAVGGALYYFIEFTYKSIVGGGITHWSMALLGGLMFLLIGAINEYVPWNLSVIIQGVIGSLIITLCELLVGLVVNLHFELQVWDYSDLPLNVLGQICLPFSLLWILLAIVAIILDDCLRHWLFQEEKPRYTMMPARRRGANRKIFSQRQG